MDPSSCPRVEHPKVAALWKNIKLGWNCLSGTNTLAYLCLFVSYEENEVLLIRPLASRKNKSELIYLLGAIFLGCCVAFMMQLGNIM
jgi:hypothetical protein